MSAPIRSVHAARAFSVILKLPDRAPIVFSLADQVGAERAVAHLAKAGLSGRYERRQAHDRAGCFLVREPVPGEATP